MLFCFLKEGVLQRDNQTYVIYPDRPSPDFSDKGELQGHVLRRINQTDEMFETDYILAGISSGLLVREW